MQMDIVGSNRWLGQVQGECVHMAHTDEGPRFPGALLEQECTVPKPSGVRLLSCPHACLPLCVLAILFLFLSRPGCQEGKSCFHQAITPMLHCFPQAPKQQDSSNVGRNLLLGAQNKPSFLIWLSQVLVTTMENWLTETKGNMVLT